MSAASPTPLAPGGPDSRDNHFNFLRLLLASLVLLAHAPELVDGNRRREPLTRLFGTMTLGDLAVAGFFLLSGFLIVQSWQRRPHLAAFLASRLLRIYPGFAAASLASVLVFGSLGAANAGRYLAQVDYPWLLQSVVLLRSPSAPPTFIGTPHAVVNGSLWTISYEFSCYLCAALLGICGLVRHRRGFLGFTLLVAAAWLLPLAGYPLAVFSTAHLGRTGMDAVHIVLLLCKDNSPFLHLLFVFCVGGCFALFRDRVRFSPAWALAGLPVVAVCLSWPATGDIAAGDIAVATVGAYTFFTFAFARIPLLALFKGHTDISYGVYLYGWPVAKLILWHWPTLSPWTLFLLSAVGSALAGWLSWRLVERPFLRFKRRPAPATPDTPPAQPISPVGAAIAFATPPVRG